MRRISLSLLTLALFGLAAMPAKADYINDLTFSSTSSSYNVVGFGPTSDPNAGWIHTSDTVTNSVVNQFQASADSDPTYNMSEDIFNGSGGDWQEYDLTFAIVSGSVTGKFTGASVPALYLDAGGSPSVTPTTIRFFGPPNLPDSTGLSLNYTIEIDPLIQGNQSFTWSVTETPVPVPEPASLALVGLAAAGLLMRRRSR